VTARITRLAQVAFLTPLILLIAFGTVLLAGEESRSGAAPPVQFVDVAERMGLTDPNVWGGIEEKRYIIETKGNGLAFFDFDHDGWLDVYLTNGLRLDEDYTTREMPSSRLYRNIRGERFEDVTEKSGLARTGWQTGVCVGDFDNDGWNDLFTSDWGYNALYRNRGDGTFEEISRRAGVRGDRVRWGSGCTWFDYDRDGNLDLFVANYIELDLSQVPKPGETSDCIWRGVPVMCGPRGLPGGSNLLYRNNGDGTFEDVSAKAGIPAPGPTYSITPVAADFDNDGWPDVYVAVDSRASLLFRNRGDGTFEEIGLVAGCAFSENGTEQAGMGVAVGDFNNNGWFDIFKTNFQYDTCNLYQNNGDGTFWDVAVRAGLAINTQYVNWGAGFIDIDNDGWLDIFYVTGHVYPNVEALGVGVPMNTPRLVYRNLGDGRFEDVSAAMGEGVTQRFSSRGSAYGDFDNNGTMDVLVLNLNDRPSLLRCDSSTGHHWLGVTLVGTRGNRSAIGARVRVVTGELSQMREVASGGSVMSQSDLRLHFGLGTASTIDALEVTWPTTGDVERFSDVVADRFITIREGAGIVTPDRRPAISGQRPAASGQRSASSNQQPAASGQPAGSRWAAELGTLNQEPGTLNQEP
jgi:enediyne biosynthesis protein E4